MREEKNIGFSRGNNLGIKIAKKEYDPDYFILLNDDLEFIDRNWIKKAVKYLEKNKKVGIAGVQLLYPDKTFQDAGGYLKKWELTKILKFKEGAVLDVDHFMGACIIIKKEVIKKIGGLDEIFSPFLFEDSDFCLRAKRVGFEIKVLTSIKIIHKKSKTVGSFSNSKHLFVRFKNDFIFAIRHLSFSDALFRIFVFIPLVAIFKKKKDQTNLKNINNFKIRKKFLINIFLLLAAYIFDLVKIKKILSKDIKNNYCDISKVDNLYKLTL